MKTLFFAAAVTALVSMFATVSQAQSTADNLNFMVTTNATDEASFTACVQQIEDIALQSNGSMIMVLPIIGIIGVNLDSRAVEQARALACVAAVEEEGIMVPATASRHVELS